MKENINVVISKLTTLSNTPSRTILVDLDGVVANFLCAIANAHDRPDITEFINTHAFRKPSTKLAPIFDIRRELQINDRDFYRPINKQGINFWSNIDLLPYAKELVCKLLKLGNVYFCTSPTIDPQSLAGKAKWIRKHFPGLHQRFVITRHKYLLAKPNAILIDDDPHNIDLFRANGGKVLLFPQIWNVGWEPIKEERVCHTIEAVKQVLCQDSVRM